jgi:hypothetical protein
MFDSAAWLLVFRIFLPSLAFMVAIDAMWEMCRIYSLRALGVPDVDSRKLAHMVCALEAPAMLIFGIALASGLYGPRALPVQVLNVTYSQFQGVGVFTSTLLALFLRQESASFQQSARRERHSIFDHDVSTLWLLFAVFVVPDLLSAVIIYFAWEIAFMIPLYTFANVFAAVYFMSKARALREPLIGFLRRVETSSESSRKIGRLLFWLGASALFMIMNSVSLAAAGIVLFKTGFSPGAIPQQYFSGLFIVCVSRIMISASQIQACCSKTLTMRLVHRGMKLASQKMRGATSRQHQVQPHPNSSEDFFQSDGPSGNRLTRGQLSAVVEVEEESSYLSDLTETRISDLDEAREVL